MFIKLKLSLNKPTFVKTFVVCQNSTEKSLIIPFNYLVLQVTFN